MKKLCLAILPVIAAASLFAVGSAGARPQAASGSKVKIVMRDPGCHWFAVGKSFKTNLTVKGPATVTNLDEAALKFGSSAGKQRVAVGHKVVLHKGRYTIHMVGQKSDDNTLHLVVR